MVNGQEMEQWQYGVTGAGRLWCCIDDDRQTVWLTGATTGHPEATEQPRAGHPLSGADI